MEILSDEESPGATVKVSMDTDIGLNEVCTGRSLDGPVRDGIANEYRVSFPGAFIPSTSEVKFKRI